MSLGKVRWVHLMFQEQTCIAEPSRAAGLQSFTILAVSAGCNHTLKAPGRNKGGKGRVGPG